MKLEEKGRIIAPPVLSKYSELVSQEIQQWEGIISATHWEIWDRNGFVKLTVSKNNLVIV